MAKLFFAFDELDEHMGSFNQGCKEDFEEFLASFVVAHDTKFIDAGRMNSVYISLVTKELSGFVFAAYSHGNETSLLVSNSTYVACEENSSSFAEALFYTVSCHSAKQLGLKLVESGCKCYIGYKVAFEFWGGYKECSSCANFGLLRFLEGYGTVEAYRRMKSEYTKTIDEIIEENPLVAASLRSNRDGLVLFGEDFSINDLN